MRNMYTKYVDLTNKAAKMNGFRDGTEMQIHSYESKTFVQEMAETWNGLKVILMVKGRGHWVRGYKKIGKQTLGSMQWRKFSLPCPGQYAITTPTLHAYLQSYSGTKKSSSQKMKGDQSILNPEFEKNPSSTF